MADTQSSDQSQYTSNPDGSRRYNPGPGPRPSNRNGSAGPGRGANSGPGRRPGGFSSAGRSTARSGNAAAVKGGGLSTNSLPPQAAPAPQVEPSKFDDPSSKVYGMNRPTTQKSSQPAAPAPSPEETAAQHALNAASAATGKNLNRPLTGVDRDRFSTPQERAGKPGGNPASINRIQASAAFVRGHRRQLGFGGGILALMMALIFGFIALLPGRIESLISNFFQNHVGNRVEYFIEKRAERWVEKYIVSSVNANCPPGTPDCPAFERNIVATGSFWKDLYKTYKVNKFEDKLLKNKGIQWQPGAKKGEIDIFHDGQKIGTLADKHAKDYVFAQIKSQTHWWQWYKRLHLRSWMLKALGLKRFNWFKNDKDPQEAKDEVSDNMVESAETAAAGLDVQALECGGIGGSSSCGLDDSKNPDTITQDQPITDPNLGSRTNGSADSQLAQDVADANQTALQKFKAARAAADKAQQELISKVLTTFLGDVLGPKIAAQYSSGALAIVSGIDEVARLDHFVTSKQADRVVSNVHKTEYALLFSQWLSMNDQINNGQNVSAEEVNASNKLLDGGELSAASQCLYSGSCDGSKGQPYTTVSDGKGGTTDTAGTRSVADGATPILDKFNSWKNSSPVLQYYFTVLHVQMLAWYNSVGWLWSHVQFLISKIGFIINFANPLYLPFKLLLDHTSIGHNLYLWAQSHISEILIEFLKWLIVPAVDGTEHGADLVSSLGVGAAVMGQAFDRNLGAPPVSPHAAAQINAEIAQANIDQAKQLSLADRLFSSDYPQSLANTLALMVPTSPSAALNDTMRYMASIFSNPFQVVNAGFNLISPSAHAAAANINSPGNEYGLTEHLYTDAQLNMDDTAELQTAWDNAATRLGKDPNLIDPADPNALHFSEVTLDDCPQAADPDATDPATIRKDLCRADVTTGQSLGAEDTDPNAADGGPGF